MDAFISYVSLSIAITFFCFLSGSLLKTVIAFTVMYLLLPALSVMVFGVMNLIDILDFWIDSHIYKEDLSNNESLHEKEETNYVSIVQNNIDFTLKYMESAMSCIADQYMIEKVSSIRKIIERFAEETDKDKNSFTQDRAETINTCLLYLTDILQKYIDTESSEEDKAITIRNEMAAIESVFETILESIKGPQEQGEYTLCMQQSPEEIMANHHDSLVLQQDIKSMPEINRRDDTEALLAKPVLPEEAIDLFEYLSTSMDKVKNKQMEENLKTLSGLLEKIIDKQKAGVGTAAGSIYFSETKNLINAYLEIEDIPSQTTQESAQKIRDTMPDIIYMYEGILDSMWKGDTLDAEITAQVLIEKGQMDGYLPGQMAKVNVPCQKGISLCSSRQMER